MTLPVLPFCTTRLPALQEMAQGAQARRAAAFLRARNWAAGMLSVRRWQNRLNTVMEPLAGGCHLNATFSIAQGRLAFHLGELKS